MACDKWWPYDRAVGGDEKSTEYLSAYTARDTDKRWLSRRNWQILLFVSSADDIFSIINLAEEQKRSFLFVDNNKQQWLHILYRVRFGWPLWPVGVLYIRLDLSPAHVVCIWSWFVVFDRPTAILISIVAFITHCCNSHSTKWISLCSRILRQTELCGWEKEMTTTKIKNGRKWKQQKNMYDNNAWKKKNTAMTLIYYSVSHKLVRTDVLHVDIQFGMSLTAS